MRGPAAHPSWPAMGGVAARPLSVGGAASMPPSIAGSHSALKSQYESKRPVERFRDTQYEASGHYHASSGAEYDSGLDASLNTLSGHSSLPGGRRSRGRRGRCAGFGCGVFLALVALATCGVAGAFLWMSRAAWHEDFRLVSLLAWNMGFPSMYGAMVGLVGLALCAVGLLGCAAFAIAAGKAARPRRPAAGVRWVAAGESILGLCIVVLAVYGWLCSVHARPHVVRSANLICQDPTLWDCETPTSAPQPVTFQPTQRPHAVNTTWHHIVDVGYFKRVLGEASWLSEAIVPHHHVGFVGNAAKIYVDSFDDRAKINGVSELCMHVKTMCEPPPTFEPATACVCNGRMDFVENGAQPFRPTGLKEEGDFARVFLAAGAHHLDEAPSPWHGGMGAYCGVWTTGKHHWCFVRDSHYCAGGFGSEYTVSNHTFQRSSGPCTPAVDSSSAQVLRGFDAVAAPLCMAMALGCLLLVGPCCAWCPRCCAGAAPRGGGPKGGILAGHGDGEDGESLAGKLRDAELRAASRAGQVSADMQLMLHGFLMQAREGDVRGRRPDFFRRTERARYDFWARHRGMPRALAAEKYIELVSLIP
mmetsp:Transcript_95451/g.270210  ORF Transcript_95451/g.270210 Transcript_95451/m.270210 type:complete len:588 (-) Transcript_95451:199-1962(-)